MIRNNLKTVGYGLFGIFCFIFFIAIQFPYKTFVPTVLESIEKKIIRDPSIQLEANNITPYWFTGLTLHDVKIQKNNQPLFSAKKISARIRVIPIFLKKLSVGFKTQYAGGTLSGHAGQMTPKLFRMPAPNSPMFGKVKVSDLNVAQIGALKESLNIPLQGVLSGDLVFDINMAKFNEGKVDIDLALDKGKLGPGTIYGFELPSSLRLDNQGKPAPMKASMKAGKLTPNIKVSNADGQIILDGEINVNPRWRLSTFNVKLAFNLSAEKKGELPSFLFDTLLKKAEGSDGLYHYNITGNLRRPRIFPARN